MAVHAFFPGTEMYLLLIISSAVCLAGVIVLFRYWGNKSACRFFSAWRREAFRLGIVSFVKTLIVEVLLQRRVWNRSKYRWFSHMAIFWSFLVLGAFTLISLVGIILSILDPDGFGGSMAQFLDDLHLPYDLLAYVLLAASLFFLVRRIILPKVRSRSYLRDFFIILSVFIISLTGIIAEWLSGYSTFFGKTLLNWDAALQVLELHIFAVFLLFFMVIPWTRFKHIITVPLLLLARRGGE